MSVSVHLKKTEVFFQNQVWYGRISEGSQLSLRGEEGGGTKAVSKSPSLAGWPLTIHRLHTAQSYGIQFSSRRTPRNKAHIAQLIESANPVSSTRPFPDPNRTMVEEFLPSEQLASLFELFDAVLTSPILSFTNLVIAIA
jgi:hypothetical protein